MKMKLLRHNRYFVVGGVYLGDFILFNVCENFM